MKFSNWLSVLFLFCLLGFGSNVYAQDILIPGTGGSGQEKTDTKEEDDRNDSKTNTGTSTNSGKSSKSNSVKPGQSKKVDVKGGQSGFDWGKVILEPNFVFNGGNAGLMAGLGFVAGYRFTPKMEAAAGPDYLYVSRNWRDLNGNLVKQTSSSIGVRALARTMVMESIFAHAEYQHYRHKFNDNPNAVIERRFPIGGGFRQRMGGNTFMNVMLLYDVLYDENGSNTVALSPFVYNVSFTMGGAASSFGRGGFGRR